jgi:hypothetical protein
MERYHPLMGKVRPVGVAMSAVCQVALQEAVERVTAEAVGMERIWVVLGDHEGAHPRTAAFTGRWVVEPTDDNRTAMENLRPQRRIRGGIDQAHRS